MWSTRPGGLRQEIFTHFTTELLKNSSSIIKSDQMFSWKPWPGDRELQSSARPVWATLSGEDVHDVFLTFTDIVKVSQ